ncbi:unnamed protein product [Staurois parvus]|uniref:Uncharacterized protein n=1 Tax=Staurois parvus TaxID=386267 RepID=A0ABN9B5S3_9NEOB|nr:unnamed protein product [Staurois parvus]
MIEIIVLFYMVPCGVQLLILPLALSLILLFIRAIETVQHFQKERFITKRSSGCNKNIYRNKM